MRDFQSLANVGAARPEKEVLGNLHGDRRGAARRSANAVIVDDLAHRAPIDAVVAAEMRVLRGDDGSPQSFRHAGQRHPFLIDPLMQEHPPEHQGRDRIDEPIGDDEPGKDQKKQQNRAAHPSARPLQRPEKDADFSPSASLDRSSAMGQAERRNWLRGRDDMTDAVAQEFQARLSYVADATERMLDQLLSEKALPGETFRPAALPWRHALCEPRRRQAAAAIPAGRDGAALRDRRTRVSGAPARLWK